jgi:hypothetical protein
MPKITVVNPCHWLNEDGSFPDEPRLRKRIIRVAQCIEYAGNLRAGETRETLLTCRGRGCAGFLVVLKQTDDAIQAFCSDCAQDEFLIYEWEGTRWAKGQGVARHVAEIAEDHGIDVGPAREPMASDLTKLLDRSLALLGSALSAGEVRKLVATAENPGVVAEAVMDAISGPPPTKGAVERFLPVLMEIWNETPRTDLGGRSPSQVYRAGQPSASETALPLNEGRNKPCACGSGKKYKRCCMSEAN